MLFARKRLRREREKAVDLEQHRLSAEKKVIDSAAKKALHKALQWLDSPEGKKAIKEQIIRCKAAAKEERRRLKLLNDPEEAKRSYCKSLFRQFDTDGSEELDKDEVRGLFKDLAIPMAEEELERFMVEVGKDNGEIDFDEFYDWYTSDFHEEEASRKFSFGRKMLELKLKALKKFRDLSGETYRVEARRHLISRFVGTAKKDALIMFRARHKPRFVCARCLAPFVYERELHDHMMKKACSTEWLHLASQEETPGIAERCAQGMRLNASHLATLVSRNAVRRAVLLAQVGGAKDLIKQKMRDLRKESFQRSLRYSCKYNALTRMTRRSKRYLPEFLGGGKTNMDRALRKEANAAFEFKKSVWFSLFHSYADPRNENGEVLVMDVIDKILIKELCLPITYQGRIRLRKLLDPLYDGDGEDMGRENQKTGAEVRTKKEKQYGGLKDWSQAYSTDRENEKERRRRSEATTTFRDFLMLLERGKRHIGLQSQNCDQGSFASRLKRWKLKRARAFHRVWYFCRPSSSTHSFAHLPTSSPSPTHTGPRSAAVQ